MSSSFEALPEAFKVNGDDRANGVDRWLVLIARQRSKD